MNANSSSKAPYIPNAPLHASTMFLDLDDTIIQKFQVLTEESRKALIRANAEGVNIVICTGRSFSMVPASVKALPFIRYYITSNGSRILDSQGNVIFLSPIPRADLLELLHAMRPYTNRFTGHIGDGLQDSLPRALPHPSLAKLLHFLSAGEVRRRKAMHIQTTPFFTRWVRTCDVCPGKLTITFNSPQLAESAKPVLDTFSDRFEFAFVSPTSCETTAKGITKGSAIAWLCDYMDISTGDTIAIGDSENDISMFQVSGYGVSIGQGSPELCRLAQYIAPPIAEEGAAQFISAFLDQRRESHEIQS